MVKTVATDFLSMTPCAAKYALAIIDPWSASAQGACIPNKAARPSQKVTSFARFDVAIGTQGFGWVMFSPCLANNSFFARYTTSAYALTDATAPDWAAAGSSSIGMSNLPYTNAQLNDSGAAGSIPAIQGRIVAFAASARYIGTELNRSGSVVCFSDPGHENVNGITYADILSRTEASFEIPNSDRSECKLSVIGITDSEQTYPDIAYAPDATTANILACYPFSTGNTASAATLGTGSSPAIIMFHGVAGMTYHVEVVVHCEYIGALAEAKTTPNTVDEIGFARIQGAASRLPQKKISNPGVPMKKLFIDCLKETWRDVGPAAMEIGKSILLSAL